MEKKGLLHLVIEIDYDKMITPEKLEALQGFTGAITEEDIAKHHLDGLGRKLTEVIRDLPLMRYEITGELTAPIENTVPPEPEPEPTPEPVEEDGYDAMPDEPISEEKAIPNPDEDEEEELSVLDELNEALDEVSMSKGMPISILINSFTEAAMRADNEVYDGIIEQYRGFDIHTESMEENFIIQYKEYNSGKISSFSAKEFDKS